MSNKRQIYFSLSLSCGIFENTQHSAHTLHKSINKKSSIIGQTSLWWLLCRGQGSIQDLNISGSDLNEFENGGQLELYWNWNNIL